MLRETKLCAWKPDPPREFDLYGVQYYVIVYRCAKCGAVAEDYILRFYQTATLDPYKLPCRAGRPARGS